MSSPSGLHHEHATAALRSGAHILLQKPMTIASEEAWDIFRVAEDNQRELLISFGWNYMDIVKTAVSAVRDIGIGTLEHMTIQMSSQTRELLSKTGAYPDASPDTIPQAKTWTDRLSSGGGYGQAQLSQVVGVWHGELVPNQTPNRLGLRRELVNCAGVFEEEFALL